MATIVTPAQAGVQESRAYADTVRWIPAYAGMTIDRMDASGLRLDTLAAYPAAALSASTLLSMPMTLFLPVCLAMYMRWSAFSTSSDHCPA
ncbi:hypothetical protein MSR1_14680 [Magnetospirillum gryphiswaldense MSR-1]|nr:hypothetical protein MSR1_14680 [Magnetospirillum gryphiswaldense MSR-1]AVM77863.1 hypothetical protein MSR1L_14680 [Magnetospirillum gryphiswaldense]